MHDMHGAVQYQRMEYHLSTSSVVSVFSGVVFTSNPESDVACSPNDCGPRGLRILSMWDITNRRLQGGRVTDLNLSTPRIEVR